MLGGGVLAVLLAAQSPASTAVPYLSAIDTRPSAGDAVCAGGLCQEEALDSFFKALGETEAGQATSPVHIVQLGDSHTAGDRITGSVRARLQNRFGSAGRGAMPPGIPYPGYGPLQVEVQGWSAKPVPLVPRGGTTFRAGLVGSFAQPEDTERLTIKAEPGASFDVVGFCAEATVESDGLAGWVGLKTDSIGADTEISSAKGKPDCWRIELHHRTAEVLIDTTRKVGLHEVWTSRAGPGVILSNLGVVGATLRDLAARDDEITKAQMTVWDPTLVVVAFGVNDGFEDTLVAEEFESLLRAQITRLKQLAPQASLLVLGAPDALRAERGGAVPLGTDCSAGSARYAPPSLAVVRDVQRRVSADMGVAFWDWRGRMGGDCSAERLATLAEPYMRPDRVHFTSVGADWIGGILSDDLMAAYDRWKAREGEAN